MRSASGAGTTACGSTTAAFFSCAAWRRAYPPPVARIGVFSAEPVSRARRGGARGGRALEQPAPRRYASSVCCRVATVRLESTFASCAAGGAVKNAARHVFVRVCCDPIKCLASFEPRGPTSTQHGSPRRPRRGRHGTGVFSLGQPLEAPQCEPRAKTIQA